MTLKANADCHYAECRDAEKGVYNLYSYREAPSVINENSSNVLFH
jgi:hypothetical protein